MVGRAVLLTVAIVVIAVIALVLLNMIGRKLNARLDRRREAKWAQAERNARWESRMTLANGPYMEVYVEKVAYIPGKTKALESILHAEVDTRDPDFGLELAVAKASAADLVFQLNQEA